MNKSEFVALATFRARLRKFIHYSEQAARAAGITPAQHQLLLAIMGTPERDFATPTELSRAMQLRHHSVLGLISRSLKAGLVQRTKGEGADRRLVFVSLTKRGEEILNKISEDNRSELRKLGLLEIEAALRSDLGEPLAALETPPRTEMHVK